MRSERRTQAEMASLEFVDHIQDVSFQSEHFALFTRRAFSKTFAHGFYISSAYKFITTEYILVVYYFLFMHNSVLIYS